MNKLVEFLNDNHDNKELSVTIVPEDVDNLNSNGQHQGVDSPNNKELRMIIIADTATYQKLMQQLNGNGDVNND